MKSSQVPSRYIAFGLMVVVALIAYSNIFSYPFQFDDLYHIIQKSKLHSFRYFDHLSLWTNINTRPIPMFTLAVNYAMGGTNVTGYHILNLIIHIFTGLVVYFLTLQILSSNTIKAEHPIKKHKEMGALFISLLFLAHPIQTQAVTYIVQRMTSMAAMFYILSLLCYVRGRISIGNGRRKTAAAFFIGCFAEVI